MNGESGQKLAGSQDARRLPKSPHARRLLKLDVGGAFLADVRLRATLSGQVHRWARNTGRRFSIRSIRRPSDGRVLKVRVERVA
jgi:hypothetical protein